MTRQQLVEALVLERWAVPVPEVRCWTGRAPIADLLDLLKLPEDERPEITVRDVG